MDLAKVRNLDTGSLKRVRSLPVSAEDEGNLAYQHQQHPSFSNEASFRKLLSSHLSIYNVLNNPDLDVSPSFSRTQSPLLLTPELPDPSFSITLWQSISNDSVFLDNLNLKNLSPSPHNVPQFQKRNENDESGKRRPTSSILSVTTEEDDTTKDSTVLISTPKPSNVMVFETDEEDNDDDRNHVNPPNSFIMPKMSISERPNIHDYSGRSSRFQVTLLSSYGSYKVDTNYLVKSIERELSCDCIGIRHVNLDIHNDYRSSSFLRFDKSLVKNSDLIFVVNDGSSVFLEYLTSVFGGDVQLDEDSMEALPKLTIINMMTVNYFVNLFELINYLKPYQIWKTSSLKQEKLVNKVKDFIEIELNQLDHFESNKVATKDTNLSLVVSNVGRSQTMYSNLILHKRADYKGIEKKFKTDLQGSSSFSDPLLISSNFAHINILYSILMKLFSTSQLSQNIVAVDKSTPKSSRFWLICSFTVGIGFGIGIASGATSVVGLYIYEKFLQFSPGQTQQCIPVSSPATKPIVDTVVDLSKEFQGSMFQFYNEVSTDLIGELRSFSTLYVSYLRSAGDIVIDCIRGGLEKVVGLVVYTNC